MHPRTGWVGWSLASWALLPLAAGAPPEAFREGFEAARPSWRQEEADLAVGGLEHDRTGRIQHGGARSERFRFVARGPGSSVYYSLPLPKIPVVEALEVRLYARSRLPGVQLSARVILPADTDPDTGQPSFVHVLGTVTEDEDRWHALELPQIAARVEEQARILRIKTRRPIPTDGAYLERLVINLYGGPGEQEVYLDDLTIQPVPEGLAAAADGDPMPRPAGEAAVPAGAKAGAGPRVKLEAGRLTRDGKDWVPSILAAPGADLAAALPYRFDVLAVSPDADPAALGEAVRQGALLMPLLGPLAVGGDDPAAALQAAAAFPLPDAVAFWELGEGLGAAADPEVRKAELARARAILTELRQRPNELPRLTTAVLEGDFAKYVRPGQSLDLIGIEPRSWGSPKDPLETFQYLRQRRQLTALQSVNALYWAWITAAAPRGLRSAIWGEDVPPEWGRPRVLPEQVRLGAYAALMAGYRGLGFRADSDLSRAAGRALLIELGLLNAEIDLLEAILARGQDPIAVFPGYRADPIVPKVFNPNVTAPGYSYANTKRPRPRPEQPPHESIRASAIATQDGKGRLVLVADLAAGAQYQPPQMALHNLNIRVPGAPESAQPWELTLGGVRGLDRQLQADGVRVTIPLFDTTAIVLLTTDLAHVERLQQAVQVIRPWAVNLALKQSHAQIEWVQDTVNRLAQDGSIVPETPQWIAFARASLQAAQDALAREDYQLAWDESRAVLRFLRLIMRAHYDQSYQTLTEVIAQRQASEGTSRPAPPLVTPSASPALLAFNTLPQHALWCSWLRSGTFSANLVPTGSFDGIAPDGLAKAGWTDASYRDALVPAQVRLAPDPDRGRADAGAAQLLRLTVPPVAAAAGTRGPSFLDHPAAAVQTPPLAVSARQLLRIRILVRMPQRLTAGTSGLIVRDSIGGDQLAFRTTQAIPDWREVTLLRRAPADGTLTVTLGLAGFGEVEFDDLRIDALTGLPGADASVADGSAPPTPGPNARPLNPPSGRRPVGARLRVIR